MKEATSELNMSVVVIISVGILAAFFFGFLWPILKNNFNAEAQCNKAICDCSRASSSNDYMCECHMDGSSTTFECAFKG